MAQNVQAQRIDRISTTCPNECCQQLESKPSTKRVSFQEEAQIVDTIAISDLSEQEIEATWLTDQDWDEMRRDFFQAKRKKCPTVEMSQPYRVSDRKATIRYSRLVVKREETKFAKSLQQWQEQPTPTTDAANAPCWNCYAERVAKLYEVATRKSRDEAYNAGHRYELLAKAQEVEVTAKPVVSPSNKRKLIPSVSVPAC